jgi:hypothetical protein
VQIVRSSYKIDFVTTLGGRKSLDSDLRESIKSAINSEIALLEKDYEIIKNSLKGFVFEVSMVRAALQSYKDRLSRVRSLLMAFFQIQGKSFDFQIRPILDSIDVALLLMEMPPQLDSSKMRGIMQLALALSETKIEDVMALISTLGKTTFADTQL